MSVIFARGIDATLRVSTPTSVERVEWQVIGGPEEWIGTTIDWDLRQEGDYTIVLFKHQGWKEPVEFMHHCSTKWATFLLSLKELVETGRGRPAPDDLKISDWH